MMKKNIILPTLLLIGILLFNSCEQKTEKIKKNNSFEYVKLNFKEIDSIYNSHRGEIVFLSFYPGMHDEIFKNYLEIEQDNGNLFYVVSADRSNYYYFDMFSNTTSNSTNNIRLIVSMKKHSVNLTSSKQITKNQHRMALDLYEVKYGKPSDTIIADNKYLMFKGENKLITFEINQNSLLIIKYWTQKSLGNYIKNYQDKLNEYKKNEEEYEKSKLQKKEKILEQI